MRIILNAWLFLLLLVSMLTPSLQALSTPGGAGLAEMREALLGQEQRHTAGVSYERALQAVADSDACVFDMDGVIASGGVVSDVMIQVLAELIVAGKMVVFASARNLEQKDVPYPGSRFIRPVVEQLLNALANRRFVVPDGPWSSVLVAPEAGAFVALPIVRDGEVSEFETVWSSVTALAKTKPANVGRDVPFTPAVLEGLREALVADFASMEIKGATAAVEGDDVALSLKSTGYAAILKLPTRLLLEDGAAEQVAGFLKKAADRDPWLAGRMVVTISMEAKSTSFVLSLTDGQTSIDKRNAVTYLMGLNPAALVVSFGDGIDQRPGRYNNLDEGLLLAAQVGVNTGRGVTTSSTLLDLGSEEADGPSVTLPFLREALRSIAPSGAPEVISDGSFHLMGALNPALVDGAIQERRSEVVPDANIALTLNLKTNARGFVVEGGVSPQFMPQVEPLIAALNARLLEARARGNALAASVLRTSYTVQVHVSKEGCNPLGLAQFGSFDADTNTVVLYLSEPAWRNPQVAGLGVYVELYRALTGEFKDEIYTVVGGRRQLVSESDRRALAQRVAQRYATVAELLDLTNLAIQLRGLETEGVFRTDFRMLQDLFPDEELGNLNISVATILAALGAMPDDVQRQEHVNDHYVYLLTAA